LLRSARTPDPYVEAFARRGWRAVCHPVLAFDFPRQTHLARRLTEAPEAYAGLVVTSPRAVRALADALADVSDEARAAWTAKRAFAVGPKTAAALADRGFAPEGQDAGRAADLARYVAEAVGEGRTERPLLFLAGNRRRDDLPEGLRAAGVPFDEMTVYATGTRADLSLPNAAWLAFFSPSGVQAVQAAAGVALGAYRRAAIGPTTAQALADAGHPAHAVADAPTPDALASSVAR
jgi:uroporphyrinogen-III synthase